MKQKLESKKDLKYRTLGELGSGSYGTVFKGELRSKASSHQQCQQKDGGQYFALKQIKLGKADEGIPSTTIRQIAILKELSHPNIVRFIEVISEPTSLIMVFEYVECDLKQFMQSISKEVGMDPNLTKALCYQLLKGVSYCHENNVLHRDLKPQNLLISKNNVLKITDFGLAREFGIPNKGFTHEVVTLWYRAPDVLLQSVNYCQNIDIWSIGCILAEMVNLRPLFAGQKQEEQLLKIFRVLGTPTEQSWPNVTSLPGWAKYKINEMEKFEPMNLQDLFPKLSAPGIDLLSKLLSLNPKCRITAEEALEHEYFDGLPEKVLGLYKQMDKQKGWKITKSKNRNQ